MNKYNKKKHALVCYDVLLEYQLQVLKRSSSMKRYRVFCDNGKGTSSGSLIVLGPIFIQWSWIAVSTLATSCIYNYIYFDTIQAILCKDFRNLKIYLLYCALYSDIQNISSNIRLYWKYTSFTKTEITLNLLNTCIHIQALRIVHYDWIVFWSNL